MVVVPGPGFLHNTEMDAFPSTPAPANTYGLVHGAPTAIAPATRLLSSMTPTIV
jgi:gamma-glutamyltranspeptidase/glutathione hydrolase